MAYKNENEKEFFCKQCAIFYDAKELEDGKCPECKTDDELFINDGNED